MLIAASTETAQILVILHGIGATIIVGEIMYILLQRPSKLQVRALVMLIAALVYMVGYCFELVAGDMWHALDAIKIEYLGLSFMLLFTFLFIAEFCRISLPKRLCTALGIFSSVVVIAVMTCEEHQLFYTSYDYAYDGIVPHIVLGHGVLYYIHSAAMILYLFIGFIWIVRELIRVSKTGNTRNPYIMMGVSIMIALAGYLLYAWDLTNGYDSSFLGTMIGSNIMSIMFIKYKVLDMITVAKDQAIDEMENGIVFLDDRGDVAYMNRQAREITELGKDIPYIVSCARNDSNLEVNNRIYKASTSVINNEGWSYGIIIELMDVTDSHNYVARLEKEVAERSEELLTKEKELEKMKTEATISQLQPHFMYNTLSAIASLPGNSDETVNALVDFGKYLRGSLNAITSEGLIPIEQELQHVKKYVELEKLRFEDKINVIFDIYDADYGIPPLSVQMLVENAIKHGLQPKKGRGTVRVTAELIDGNHVITIEDDGIGFDATAAYGKEHVGLGNIRSRLKSMCDGTLEIKSTINEGTTARIVVPGGEEE